MHIFRCANLVSLIHYSMATGEYLCTYTFWKRNTDNYSVKFYLDIKYSFLIKYLTSDIFTPSVNTKYQKQWTSKLVSCNKIKAI